MTFEEKHDLICSIIEKFLSRPIAYISQEAVINATVQLGVSDSVLIKYLGRKLGISAAK